MLLVVKSVKPFQHLDRFLWKSWVDVFEVEDVDARGAAL